MYEIIMGRVLQYQKEPEGRRFMTPDSLRSTDLDHLRMEQVSQTN
jgi:hypothetical protein